MNVYQPYDSQELAVVMQKMYPDTPYQEKYLLFIQCDLYWKYALEDMSCSIKIYTINGTEIIIPETKIRRPYPNKNVTQLSMKKKRSCCDYGIIIPFDNYKDLTNICEIQVSWDVEFRSKLENGTLQLRKHVLISKHKISFKAETNKRMYGIKCEENTMFTNDEILNKNPEETSIEEYDIYICCIENKSIAIGKCSDEEMDERMYSVVKELEKNQNKFDKVSVDYYERTLEIIPFEI